MMKPVFISFASGIVGVIHDTSTWPLPIQMVERCESMQQHAKVLDSEFRVLGECRWTSAGYIYYPIEVS